MRSRIIVIVALLLLIAAPFSLNAEEKQTKKAKVGEKFVDFTAKTLKNDNFKFGKAIKGKTAIIKIGALWCGPCVRMHPELMKVHENMSKDVVIVEIDMMNNKSDTEEKVRGYNEKHKTPWEVVMDYGSVSAIYLPPRSGIPHSIVIGPDGIVKTRWKGSKKFEDMKRELDFVIAGKPLPPKPGSIGSIFPDFTLQDLDDKEFNLAKALKKGPVVIKFGAVWCGPCEKMHPVITKLLEKYGKKASIVEIDLLDARRKETKEKVIEHNKEKGTKYRVLLDNEYSVFKNTGEGSIPITLIIDKYGRISAKLKGVVTYEVVEEALLAALKAKKPKKKKDKDKK